MRKSLLILSSFSFVLLSAACTVDEDIAKKTGNQSPVMTPDIDFQDSISTKVFDYLNLDYAGLEKVKEHYTLATSSDPVDEAELYLAAYELLDYYRSRSFIMPDYTFINPYASDSDINIADQAIEHRFYVRNFTDGTTADGKEQYYLFPDKTDENGKTVIDWEYVPDNLQYSENEWKSQRFRHQWMMPQAKAYGMTKDEKYIESWIEVYGDFMNQYPCPEGKISGESASATAWTNLQVAERTSEQPAIIKYFINSVNFTPGWLTQVLATYAEGVESIIQNPYYAPENNIYFSQIKAVTTAGIMFPEFKNATEWINYATQQINSQLDLQFRPDGVHNDLDPSYHRGTLDNFYTTYMLVQANGREDVFPADLLGKLKNACWFMIDVTYPDYLLEYFNDTRRTTKNVMKRNFTHYSEMFPDDQEILWMATEGARGTMPSKKIATYPDGGYYMLRNGWTKDATMLIIKNNDNYDQRWHCQPDNNTIGLYSNGRHFLPDAGAFSYGGSDEDEANRATYAATSMHNTMTSNGADIPDDRMRGRLLKAEEGTGYNLIVTENDSYDGMSHRRATFFVEDKFFVLVDEGHGNKEHTACLSFLFCETKNNVPEDKYENEANAYGAHSIFSDNNNMIFKTFTETTEGLKKEWNTKYYSPEIGEKVQRPFYKVSVRKPADKAARFITVIYPLGAPDTFANTAIAAEFTDNAAGEEGTFNENGASVKVTIDGKEYNLSYTLD